MAYSDFTLELTLQRFGLRLDDQTHLFQGLPAVDPGEALRATLADTVPLATAVHTEKARSELIVAPILLETWRRMGRRVSFFSGVALDVDFDEGLNGVCDFLFSRSPTQFVLGPPVLAVVEAKNDSIRGGLGQCAAELVASRLFNTRQVPPRPLSPHERVHGVVTTGSLWRFLRLEDKLLQIDRVEYTHDQVGEILAILMNCLEGPESSSPTQPEGIA